MIDSKGLVGGLVIVDELIRHAVMAYVGIRVIHIALYSHFSHIIIEYPAAMNTHGYTEVPQNGEMHDYMRHRLDERAVIKAKECLELLPRLRTERTICFALDTALELYGVETPYCPRLSVCDFRVVVRDRIIRSCITGVDFRTWDQAFAVRKLDNGLACMHPVDTWIQYARYLDLMELVVLGESIIRRFHHSTDELGNRLSAFKRIVGRARCKAALPLMRPSDSVQETRSRLTLLRYGLSMPVMHHDIAASDGSTRHTVDMAYPKSRVAIEYDGDHHRRFRSQYVRDQRKRRDLRAMGWNVIEVFADDLNNDTARRDFARTVANAIGAPFIGAPLPEFHALADPALRPNARRGEYLRRALAREAAMRRPSSHPWCGDTLSP
ncbi:endonuclease domain-containing protein [Bifidobacterium aesculapii]|uniref:endonuclease domain-containing protein n=1 Tax=Bifidobacterium aesculapii TaxID=1329411 RepID=UPI000B1ED822|nr:endonuclease domain-containing protein [Bifidobacterium aesculapii]